jgi:hypothetical protein
MEKKVKREMMDQKYSSSSSSSASVSLGTERKEQATKKDEKKDEKKMTPIVVPVQDETKVEDENKGEEKEKTIFSIKDFRQFQRDCAFIVENEHETDLVMDYENNVLRIERTCLCLRLARICGFFRNFRKEVWKSLSFLLCHACCTLIGIILLWNTGAAIRIEQEQKNNHYSEEPLLRLIPPLDFQYSCIFLFLGMHLISCFTASYAYNQFEHSSHRIRDSWTYMKLKCNQKNFPFPTLQINSSDAGGAFFIILDICLGIVGLVTFGFREVSYGLLLLLITGFTLPVLMRWYRSGNFYIDELLQEAITFADHRYGSGLEDKELNERLRENQTALICMRRCLFS